jgi:hypothetical protein
LLRQDGFWFKKLDTLFVVEGAACDTKDTHYTLATAQNYTLNHHVSLGSTWKSGADYVAINDHDEMTSAWTEDLAPLSASSP